MRVDPWVNRTKYSRELSLLRERRDVIEKLGVHLLASSEYPLVDLLFVPRHRIRVAVPISHQGQLFLPPGARAVIETPGLSATSFKARFDLTDYDLMAPSLVFLDPWTDAVLQYGQMFRALQFDSERKAHIVLLDDHPVTHKPFLCLRGIREYHEHPQHSGDQWLLYRNDMNMFSIVMSLWRVTIDLVHPVLVPGDGSLQVQWTAEEKL